jgi:hypothetical protein
MGKEEGMERVIMQVNWGLMEEEDLDISLEILLLLQGAA